MMSKKNNKAMEDTLSRLLPRKDISDHSDHSSLGRNAFRSNIKSRGGGLGSLSTVFGQQRSDTLPLDFNKICLYNREGQLACLQDRYQQTITSNAAQVVVINGSAGTGKTTLIMKFKAQLQRQSDHALFVTGTYGQTQGAVSNPYSGIVQAITELCQYMTQQGEFDDFRNRLQQELGPADMDKMMELVPALGGIYSGAESNDLEQEQKTSDAQSSSSFSLPTAPGPMAFKVFARRFRRFLKACCSPSRPLVLFLDDLHWADDNSKMLVRSIALDETDASLLVVAAFRDNEGETLFPADMTINPETMPRVSLCSVADLSIEYIAQMLADLLDIREAGGTRDLAEVIHLRTAGNCYFVIEYIKYLHSECCVYFDVNRVKWNWDINAVRAKTTASSNVVELLLAKISSLPVDVQTVLMVGSCLGFTVLTNILEYVLREEGLLDLEVSNDSTTSQEQMRDRIKWALDIAIKEGMMEAVQPPNQYKFVHNRVQQSALEELSKIPGSTLLQVRIGYYLLKLYDSGKHPLFAGIDRLNQNKSVITSNDERFRLAELNLRAAKQAMKSSAFGQAEQYFLSGIEFLGDSRWSEHYDLCAQLTIALAEVLHVNGKPQISLSTAEEVVSNASHIEHKLKGLDVQMRVCFSQLNLAECGRLASVALTSLDIFLPASCGRTHAAIEMFKTKNLLKKFRHKQRLSLPMLSDPKKRLSLHFLKMISHVALISQKTYLVLVARLRMVQIVVQNGWSSEGLYAVSSFACILAVQGKIGEALELANVCMEVMESWPDHSANSAIVMISMLIYGQLEHLRKPVHDTLEPLLYSYHIGMEIGNVADAMLALNMHGSHSLFSGMSLENLEKELRSSCSTFKEFSQSMCLSFSQANFQFTLNLAGKSSNPLLLTGEAMNEDEYYKRMSSAKHFGLYLSYFYFIRMMLHVILGSYEQANQDRMKQPVFTQSDTYIVRPFITFYGGFCCLCLARQYPEKRQAYLQDSRPYTRWMSRLVKQGRINCVPLQNLILAELKSLTSKSGSLEEVRSAYDRAIREARRSGFPVITGLAAERAADYFNLNHRSDLCCEYLELSAAEFYNYGAHAKVAQMKQRYGKMMDEVVIIIEKQSKEPKRSSAKLRGFVNRRFDSSDFSSIASSGEFAL